MKNFTNRNIKIIAFDLDGTLYDFKIYWENVFEEISDYLNTNFGCSKKETFSCLIQTFTEYGSMESKLFDKSLISLGFSSREIKIMLPDIIEIYKSSNKPLEPYLHTKELLLKLKNKYKLAIISNGYTQTQKRKLVNLGLYDFFDYLIFPSKENWKPSLHPFLELSNSSKVTLNQIAYIGDNPYTDFPNDDNLFKIRILKGEFVDQPNLNQMQPNISISDLSELEFLL